MIDKLLSPEVQKFIKDHQTDDPFLLSLNAKKGSDFPMKEVAEQIQSYQKARTKLPSWAEKEEIVWPPPISVEQSSSEITARFKATLIHGNVMADLTGGMGVDTSFFADQFEELHYVEPSRRLCELADYNFKVLRKRHIHIHHGTSEEFLNENLQQFDAVFIDPSRRKGNQRVFKIEDCSPDLYEVVPRCKEISSQVLLKLSPLADLSLLIRDFGPTHIWLIAVKNEVKEVLCLIRNKKKPTQICALDLDGQGKIVSEFKFFRNEEAAVKSELSVPLKYLYEPNSAILKAGAFKLLGQHYNVKKLHQHTHLYTSDQLMTNFPGKILKFRAVVRQDKKEIWRLFPDKKVNVITRNFSRTPNQLKKKFGLKDGGDHFLIGATLMDGKKVLLWCDMN